MRPRRPPLTHGVLWKRSVRSGARDVSVMQPRLIHQTPHSTKLSAVILSENWLLEEYHLWLKGHNHLCTARGAGPTLTLDLCIVSSYPLDSGSGILMVVPSGGSGATMAPRHRLNRGGNRRLNAIVYRSALVQAESSPQAQAYRARRQAEGKTRREAIRALKRYVIRVLWRLWQQCSAKQPALSDS